MKLSFSVSKQKKKSLLLLQPQRQISLQKELSELKLNIDYYPKGLLRRILIILSLPRASHGAIIVNVLRTFLYPERD
jgi:hypothetical protein